MGLRESWLRRTFLPYYVNWETMRVHRVATLTTHCRISTKTAARVVAPMAWMLIVVFGFTPCRHCID